MNCTKCGKEIPEGENKLCEECQKDLLASIENEEKEESILEEQKFKISSENTKEKKDEEKNKKSKNYFLIICSILVIACTVVCALYFKKLNSNVLGNTIGNIRNYGYTADDGRYIYFLSPDETTKKVGIFKARKKDGSDKTLLHMSESKNEIVSINVKGNYIYFIEINLNSELDEDDLDNKIYRMKKDGSDLEIINDNELNNDCYEIYVVGESVYYIDLNANVARMNLDGSNKEVISENGTGYLGLNEKYIIYNIENESKDNFITYIMNIDGTDPKPIIENTRLYSVNIEGDYIYYTDVDKKICRTKIGSGEEEKVLNVEAYNLNVKDGFAYYLSYKDAEKTVSIYKIDLKADKFEAIEIKEMFSYSSFLNVVDDWALYMDSNETNGFINIVRLDGSEETVELYNIDYEEYLKENYSDEELDFSEVVEDTESEVEENDNTESETSAEENDIKVEHIEPDGTEQESDLKIQ